MKNKRPTANSILTELRKVVRQFNELGVADEVYEPSHKHKQGELHVQGPKRVDAEVIKNLPYEELYHTMVEGQYYLVKLIDGALLQFDYSFDTPGRHLTRHRLAFLPSPELDPFMTLEDDYWNGQPFVDIVGHQVSPVALRIDFDNRPGVAKPVSHPACHLTLGQYLNCRIPTSGPMRPAAFASFIGRHFYSNDKFAVDGFDSSESKDFVETITAEELRSAHLRVTSASWASAGGYNVG